MPIGCHACQSWYCSRCMSGWGESTAVEIYCQNLSSTTKTDIDPPNRRGKGMRPRAAKIVWFLRSYRHHLLCPAMTVATVILRAQVLQNPLGVCVPVYALGRIHDRALYLTYPSAYFFASRERVRGSSASHQFESPGSFLGHGATAP